MLLNISEQVEKEIIERNIEQLEKNLYNVEPVFLQEQTEEKDLLNIELNHWIGLRRVVYEGN